MSGVYWDSFSGSASTLKRGHRKDADILRALLNDNTVSTFDMSEHLWLSDAIGRLKKGGLLSEDMTTSYPWHRFFVTEDGLALLGKGTP